jgi:hypothetical protein
MKIRFLFMLSLASFAAWPAPLRAQDVPVLPKDVYVFRIQLLVAPNAGIRDAAAESTSRSAGGEHTQPWQILSVPGTLRFDRWTHAPASEEFAWTVATLGTKKFNLLSMPTVITHAGQKASVIIGSTAQYFEKQADGSFRLHELPKAPRGNPQPDGPHYALTLVARPDDTTPGSLAVTFASDIVVLASREKIPGVDLDVGKPVLATIKDEQTFTARLDAWNALLCQSPGGSDYSLLVLLKVSQQEATAEHAVQKPASVAHPAPPAGTP